MTQPATTIPSPLARRALIAASTDLTRWNLYQVRVDDGRLVSTDGHRLHVLNHLDLAGLEFNIRRDVLEFTTRISPHILLAPGEVQAGGVTCRFPDVATFPPWRQVIPDREEHRWSRDPATMRRALRELSTQAAVLTEEGPQAPMEGRGYPGPIVYRAYLQDAIRAAAPGRTDEVEVGWCGPLDPITVRAPGFLGVVMPRRVP